uniref:Ovule protein n=1 Tax=Caenorhabditis tropicalis TaxID=1561998 RepID=A0A1I7UIG8_9PELO
MKNRSVLSPKQFPSDRNLKADNEQQTSKVKTLDYRMHPWDGSEEGEEEEMEEKSYYLGYNLTHIHMRE